MHRLCLILLLLANSATCAGVDTLRSVAAVDDATMYNYLDCTSEVSGENCRRYNTGAVPELRVGTQDIDDHRIVMRFPGWDRTMPDSAMLELTCTMSDDNEPRRIFVYPLTRRFFEGTESGAGAYPEPDSGVTWNHAWLDVGDLDSLPWTTPGGDYSTTVACTAIVSSPGVYRVRAFHRILSWWNSM